MVLVPTDPTVAAPTTAPDVRHDDEPREGAYQRYFHNNPVPMWIYDVHTLAYLDINPAATLEYGYSREEFLRMTLLDLRPPEERPAFLKFLATQSPDASYSGGPWTHQRKDGSRFEIIARFNPTTFNGITARIGCGMDISRQMHLQRLLENRQPILQGIAANQPLPKILEHIVEYVESQPGQMLCTILLANPVSHTLHLGAGQHMPEGYNAAIEGIAIAPGNGACGHCAATGQRYVARDVQTDPNFAAYRELLGRHGLAACTSEPIFAGTEVIATFAVYFKRPGEPDADQRQLMATAAHLVAIAIERHREHDRLRSSEEHFRQLADAAPLVVWSRLADHSSNYYNAEFYNYHGLPRGPIDRTQLLALVHPEDRPVLEAIWAEREANPRPQEWYFRLRRFDGTYRWHLSRSRPILSENGRLKGWVGMSMDIDATKQLQEEARAAAAQAQAASQSKDRFLAALSHELRTPLAPVLASLTGMLTWADLPPAVREELSMIRRNVELEARLIDDLLDLTRIARGKVQLNTSRVDLQSLIRMVAEICSYDIVAKTQVLTLDLALANPVVIADAARLQQVFWNLIKNAVKFTSAGGTIRVVTGQQGRSLTIEVTDSGRGIAPDKLGLIFDAFEQADPNVTREFGGLGLGLAISRKIVAMHGGTLTAHSGGIGQGATFRVELPLAPEHDPGETSATEAPRGSPAVVVSGQQKHFRILLVEDHIDTARVMSRMLKALGHQVTTATTVAQAIAAGMAEDFDVLLSDIGLPDGSGTEIAVALLEHKTIVAVALSGFGMESDIQRSKEAGFIQHLTKPVDLDRLQAVLQALPCPSTA